MQPRILVKQQGQQKKRFISPTQIKNNQAIHGDPMGVPKLASSLASQKQLQRLYSPQNQRSILNIEKQKQLQNSVSNNQQKNPVQYQNDSKFTQTNNSQSIVSNHIGVNNNAPQRQKSRSIKKDYMMTQLSKFNQKSGHFKRKNDDQISNGSRSRESKDSKKSSSKIYSSKNDKSGKEKTDEDQYRKGNVYSQRQKQVKRRPRNDNSRQKSSISDNKTSQLRNSGQQTGKIKSSKEQFNYKKQQAIRQMEKPLNQQNSQQFQKSTQNRQLKKLPTQPPAIKQISKKQNSHRQETNSDKDYGKSFESYTGNNYNQFDSKLVQKNQTSQPRTQNLPKQNPQQKLSFTSSQNDSNNLQFGQSRSQVQDSNNSTLAVHFKKAHQQNEELKQKNFKIQKQLKTLRQSLLQYQNTINQLRQQLSHFQTQNLSLKSQLKALHQTQSITKASVNDVNNRNEHIYRQLHEKYEALMMSYKQAIAQNDHLIETVENLKVQNLNYDKRTKFLQSKLKQLQTILSQKDEQHVNNLKQTVEEWKSKVQQLQRQHRSQNQPQLNGQQLGNVKIKMIELETELSHKSSLLSKAEDQLKYLRQQFQAKTKFMQEALFQKQSQVKQTSNQIAKQQNNFMKKITENEKQIKQLKSQLISCQKQLQLKNNQVRQLLNDRKKIQPKEQIQKIYKEVGQGRKQVIREADEAKNTVEKIVTQQGTEIMKYKQQLNSQIQRSYQLKSQLDQSHSTIKNLKQELQILQMQYSTLSKNQAQSASAQVYLLKSQLDSALRKQTQLQKKIQFKNKEIKQKDEFIQNQLMGKA